MQNAVTIDDLGFQIEYKFVLGKSIADVNLCNTRDFDILMNFIDMKLRSLLESPAIGYRLSPRLINSFMEHKVKFSKDEDELKVIFHFDAFDGAIPNQIKKLFHNLDEDFVTYYHEHSPRRRRRFCCM